MSNCPALPAYFQHTWPALLTTYSCPFLLLLLAQPIKHSIPGTGVSSPTCLFSTWPALKTTYSCPYLLLLPAQSINHSIPGTGVSSPTCLFSAYLASSQNHLLQSMPSAQSINHSIPGTGVSSPTYPFGSSLASSHSDLHRSSPSSPEPSLSSFSTVRCPNTMKRTQNKSAKILKKFSLQNLIIIITINLFRVQSPVNRSETFVQIPVLHEDRYYGTRDTDPSFCHHLNLIINS